MSFQLRTCVCFLYRWAGLLALAVALSACGGGSDEPKPPRPPTPEPAPARGDLLSAQALQRITPRQIDDALAEHTDKVSGVVARHAIRAYRLTYLTTDVDGRQTTASGLVAVPERTDGRASPVIGYQHATTFENDNAPSLRIEPEEPPLVLASLGYIVVAADYVGFGASHGQEHPYLQSEPTARAVIDMLVAARQWREQAGVADSGQLYLVGYSEGGYATMAAQRALTRERHPLLRQLVATLPAAGPYDLQATLDTQLARVSQAAPLLGVVLSPGTLRQLSGTVRREVRRALLRQMIPDEADVSYQPKFLDDYLADDTAAIRRDGSVHWGWTPTAPVHLFHGRDDQTVPWEAGVSAYATLRATGGAQVTLRECTAPVAGHLQCVPEYFRYATQTMALTSGQ